ncbi:serine protease [Streptomyces sp. NPDC002851]
MHRRPFGRALPGALALLTAAVLGPAGGAVADEGVIGGSPVRASDAPWAVALASRDRFGGTRDGQFCGGAVIGRRTVLTAAHCVSEQALGVPLSEVSDLRVIQGRSELGSDAGREVAVTRVKVNPDYDSRTNAGDFAVLELARALPASSVISMAESGDPAYAPGTAAAVYGWGDMTGSGDYARSLRAARVTVQRDTVCAEAYDNSAEGTYVRESMLCVGEDQGGRDACQGDSGGPLVARGRLVGLVSWGRGCGQAGSPGVYTRVSEVVQQVSSVVRGAVGVPRG